jgi:simple sugar transport system ATP-binding protein
MSAPIVALRGIEKSFGSVRALQGVDLAVGRGEILGLLGDNGAGKSTLIKILSGFIQADRGEILLDGQPVHFSTPATARAAGIETVYQEQALADDLSVTRNLFMGKELTRRLGPFKVLDMRQMREESRRMLEDLRLRVDVDQEARFCSGGERQGVAIARAIHFRANLVILDEPTNALGVAAVARVLDLIRELRDRGHACIFVSHNLDQVHAIADRIALLVHGTKVLDLAVGDTSVAELHEMLMARSGTRIGTDGQRPLVADVRPHPLAPSPSAPGEGEFVAGSVTDVVDQTRGRQ